MAKYYSASTKGFYCPSVHGKNIPADAVEITDATWHELLEQQSRGKAIQPDAVGFPIAVDRAAAVEGGS